MNLAIAWVLFVVAITAIGAPRAVASDDVAQKKELHALLERYKAELEAQWKTLGPFTKSEGKEEYEIEANQAERFFAERVGHNKKKQQELIDAILASKDDYWGLSFITFLLAREGNRDELVSLLSRRCPPRLGLSLGVEDLIVLYPKELKDGTIVLCDAFDQSTDTKARQTIAAALRRGFKAMGIVDADDKKLVAEVRNWYAANALNYRPNLNYLGHWSNPGFKPDTEGVLVQKGKDGGESFTGPPTK
jgi:hypothetical protein